VLEIGCGTGTLATALAERELAKVWAIDAEPAMVAQARARLPRGAQAKVAEAEALPFKDGWFDRAVMRLVVHHVDRPRAFAELHRVLVANGRLVIATLDPASFVHHWAAPFFPSLASPTRRPFVRSSAQPGSAPSRRGGTTRSGRARASMSWPSCTAGTSRPSTCSPLPR
jgi:ubiquinone/menaquinone biosynthesis C-methylase UbiE